jgi:hypothetical protein
MAKNKTQPKAGDVSSFLDKVKQPARRADAVALAEIMRKVTGQPPVMWGPSIVGFGSYHYVYDTGREGDMPVVAFSPRSTALVLYGLRGGAGADALLKKLGKHTTGGGCVYVKSLADVDRKVLETLVKGAVKARRAPASR